MVNCELFSVPVLWVVVLHLFVSENSLFFSLNYMPSFLSRSKMPKHECMEIGFLVCFEHTLQWVREPQSGNHQFSSNNRKQALS
jgi:hypothetical protein